MIGASASASASAGSRNRSPFTAAQWQELEHQALIFKYMVSGVPIPPDLIYTVKRSLDSSISSRLFTHQPSFGRKADPEPGRCRRTDGKKWRCSKEAYPDSKYCERHMHRGRNRSRKPVEVTSSTTTTTTTTNPSSISSINRDLSTPSSYSLSPFSSSMAPEAHPHHQPYHNISPPPFLYHQSSSSRPPGSAFSPQNNTTPHLFLDSGSYSQSDKDYRYFHGTRDDVDEKAFFPEVSGTVRTLPESYQPLAMSSYKGYPQSQFQNLTDNPKQKQQQQEQHCFVLGTDFKSAKSIKLEKEAETQKPLHHFFGEWPPKNTDSWLDLASNSQFHTDG